MPCTLLSVLILDIYAIGIVYVPLKIHPYVQPKALGAWIPSWNIQPYPSSELPFNPGQGLPLHHEHPPTQLSLEPHSILNHQGLSKTKSTFPELAPPTHVAFRLPVGQTALAARTHCSHRPLDMLIVAPVSVGFSANLAVPDCPVVDVGAPPHLVMAPAIPPQMPSSATFSSWKTIFLSQCVRDG